MNHRALNFIQNNVSIFIFMLFCGFAATALAAPTRVAILPFGVNAEKDLSFLQEGIVDMLASRIAWQDRVEVIGKNETTAALAQAGNLTGEKKALQVGGKLQADYVLFGSLTVLGESVSIDAKMVDVSGQQPPMPFFAQASGMDGVIPQINQIATDINQTVFGRSAAQRPAASSADQPGGSAVLAVPVPATAPSYDPHMHPEKLLQTGAEPESVPQTPVQTAPQPNQTPNPAFTATAPAAAANEQQNFWKSRSFKMLINSLAIADVDNDGRQETIIAAAKMLSVYRMENGRLAKVAEIAETRTGTYIGLDIADINGNGTPEIYVSSLGPNRTRVDSFVVEFDGSDYKTIHGSDNWLYRVAKTVDQGTILMGQQVRSAEDSIFHSPIQVVAWQGDRLTPTIQLLKGGKANVIGAAFADVAQSGQSWLLGYSTGDILRIYTPGGEIMWEDSERTGGNMVYFNLPTVDPGSPNKQFFPLRIQTADIDRNGKVEVLVALHDEFAKNMLKDFRQFRHARIECREWNGLSLVSKWRTPEFNGRASDFTVGDFDNDGADELVVAVVTKEGSIVFTDAVSGILTFDLNPQ